MRTVSLIAQEILDEALKAFNSGCVNEANHQLVEAICWELAGIRAAIEDLNPHSIEKES